MSCNVKIKYPERVISIGDLVEVDPLHIPENFIWGNPDVWPKGIVIGTEPRLGVRQYKVAFPKGDVWLVDQVIRSCT